MSRGKKPFVNFTLPAISLCINCAKNTESIAGNKKTDAATKDFGELLAKVSEISKIKQWCRSSTAVCFVRISMEF
jgi:hypothetical protein